MPISAGRLEQCGPIAAMEWEVRNSLRSFGSVAQDILKGGVKIAAHLRHALIAKSVYYWDACMRPNSSLRIAGEAPLQ